MMDRGIVEGYLMISCRHRFGAFFMYLLCYAGGRDEELAGGRMSLVLIVFL